MSAGRGRRRARLLLTAPIVVGVLAGCVASTGGRGSSAVEPTPQGSPDAGAMSGPAATASPPAVTPSTPTPSTPTAATADPAAIQALLVSRSLWPGPDRLLFVIEDGSNVPVDGPGVGVRIRVGPPDATAPVAEPPGASAPTAGAWVTARFERVAADGRGLYAADVSFAAVGRVPVDVEVTRSGTARTVRISATVRDPGATPAIGASAPRVDTPTFASAGRDLGLVTTDPVPDRRLYWLSVREAIALRRPFVLVLDSYAFRTSPACGGALGVVHHLTDDYPAVSFIHAEAYATRVVDGHLAPDPAGGPLRPAAWTSAWGAVTAPWVFVVDGDGVVRAKFSGIVGTDELRAAIRTVAGWVPTY